MPDIHLRPMNETVSADEGGNLLDILLQKDCQVMMACGRMGICATCHVYIEEGMENLSAKTSRESKTLALITGANDTSRLSCQCTLTGGGAITVILPEGLYVESFSDLEALIGKRTRVPILHPMDATVLIPKNKIITRTLIMKLQDTDFDVSSVATE